MDIFLIVHRETRQPARLSASYNGDEAEFCNDSTVTISDSGEMLAAYDDECVAQKILSREEDVGWYNSSYSKPKWGYGFNPLDYEIVKFST